jgi:ZIP family zinc transporter
MSPFAIVAVFLAGLSTVLGCFVLRWAKQSQNAALAWGLGFSAGAMIFVSLTELWRRSVSLDGQTHTFLWFMFGIAVIAAIDWALPKEHNPHERLSEQEARRASLHATGIFAALAIAIHNLPEGFATVIAATQDFSLGLPLVVAIALHNIPEGMAIALPIYAGTGNLKKAVVWTTLAALAEPIGGLLAYWAMASHVQAWEGSILAVVAGIMVYISFDELLPVSISIGKHHLTIGGIIVGIAVIGLSLALL